MTTWLTSDEHYGHAKLAEARGFASVEAMDATIVANHNALVGPGDDVFHLGDFSWKPRLVADYLAQLNGKHHLIVGNHDECHPCHRHGERRRRRYTDAGFLTVDVAAVLRVPPFGELLLCHLPLQGTGDDRFESMKPTRKLLGARIGLAHGHVHEAWTVSGRMVNVGVDVHGMKPIGAYAVVSLLHGGAR